MVLKEFREFAVKGNMLDLAIGVIIGGAFGAVVNSLVNDLLMPLIGLVTGGIDFKDKAMMLKQSDGDAPNLMLNYGVFINFIVTFLIVAFACFLLVKAMNKLKREQPAAPAAPPAPSAEEVLLTEIRDLLKSRS